MMHMKIFVNFELVGQTYTIYSGIFSQYMHLEGFFN